MNQTSAVAAFHDKQDKEQLLDPKNDPFDALQGFYEFVAGKENELREREKYNGSRLDKSRLTATFKKEVGHKKEKVKEEFYW